MVILWIKQHGAEYGSCFRNVPRQILDHLTQWNSALSRQRSNINVKFKRYNTQSNNFSTAQSWYSIENSYNLVTDIETWGMKHEKIYVSTYIIWNIINVITKYINNKGSIGLPWGTQISLHTESNCIMDWTCSLHQTKNIIFITNPEVDNNCNTFFLRCILIDHIKCKIKVHLQKQKCV